MKTFTLMLNDGRVVFVTFQNAGFLHHDVIITDYELNGSLVNRVHNHFCMTGTRNKVLKRIKDNLNALISPSIDMNNFNYAKGVAK